MIRVLLILALIAALGAGFAWIADMPGNLVLTFGGLILLGGRLGDAIGHKRAFIIGVALFTIVSAACGIAWDGGSLVVARLLQGVAAAIISPTGMALVATTFAKGPQRNAAMVEENNAEIHGLRGRAVALAEKIEHFRVGDAGGGQARRGWAA